MRNIKIGNAGVDGQSSLVISRILTGGSTIFLIEADYIIFIWGLTTFIEVRGFHTTIWLRIKIRNPSGNT
jgi:hypothetical protein